MLINISFFLLQKLCVKFSLISIFFYSFAIGEKWYRRSSCQTFYSYRRIRGASEYKLLAQIGNRMVLSSFSSYGLVFSVLVMWQNARFITFKCQHAYKKQYFLFLLHVFQQTFSLDVFLTVFTRRGCSFTEDFSYAAVLGRIRIRCFVCYVDRKYYEYASCTYSTQFQIVLSNLIYRFRLKLIW